MCYHMFCYFIRPTQKEYRIYPHLASRHVQATLMVDTVGPCRIAFLTADSCGFDGSRERCRYQHCRSSISDVKTLSWAGFNRFILPCSSCCTVFGSCSNVHIGLLLVSPASILTQIIQKQVEKRGVYT